MRCNWQSIHDPNIRKDANLSSDGISDLDRVQGIHSRSPFWTRCIVKIRSTRVGHTSFLIVMVTLSLGVGCKGSQYAERFGLGTMDQQKAKAADFDPFPLNDIGPPVMGGRPRGFMDPLPEPKRAELQARQPSPYANYNR
jgi:hypothetical protein